MNTLPEIEECARGLKKHLRILSAESTLLGDVLSSYWRKINDAMNEARVSQDVKSVGQKILDMSEEIRSEVDRIRKAHKIASFQFHEGQEIWLDAEGPGIVKGVERSGHHGKMRVLVEYANGSKGGGISSAWRNSLKDPSSDPEGFQRDKDLCRKIAELYEELMDIDVFASQLSSHAVWAIDMNPEARRVYKRLMDQFQWDDPDALRDTALQAFPIAMADQNLRRNMRVQIRDYLVFHRKEILNGEVLLEEMKNRALKEVAPNAVNLAYSEAGQILFKRFQEELRSTR